jgi:hypothetical protein
LHVSGAFLIKSVPEVVASKWEVVDELSVEIATWYYQALASKGCDINGDADTGGVLGSARALHEAVRTAKQRGRMPCIGGAMFIMVHKRSHSRLGRRSLQIGMLFGDDAIAFLILSILKCWQLHSNFLKKEERKGKSSKHTTSGSRCGTLPF